MSLCEDGQPHGNMALNTVSDLHPGIFLVSGVQSSKLKGLRDAGSSTVLFSRSAPKIDTYATTEQHRWEVFGSCIKKINLDIVDRNYERMIFSCQNANEVFPVKGGLDYQLGNGSSRTDIDFAQYT